MKFKKITALIAAGLMLVTQSAFAAEFKDMPDNWSTAALEKAVENGLLGGSDGYIYPDDNMTRAEMATIMARACGATEEADISQFTDVSVDDWYYSSMAKAVAMKAFNGSDNKLNPDNFITRQEAFVVLARVFSLNLDDEINEGVIDSFKDGNKVASWARKEVAAVIGGGYVAGADGYVNPEDNISRAEFAVVMSRLVEHYIDDAASEIPETGNVMIRVGGVTLDGLKGDRMIIIGDGAGETDIDFKNADLKGRFVVRGGKNVKLGGSFGSIRIIMPNIVLDHMEAMSTDIYVCKNSTVNIGTVTTPDTIEPETDKENASEDAAAEGKNEATIEVTEEEFEILEGEPEADEN